MKTKKEYIILAIIIIALSVYLVMRRSDRTLYELPEIPQVSQKEITRLEITRGKAEKLPDHELNRAIFFLPRRYAGRGAGAICFRCSRGRHHATPNAGDLKRRRR